MKILFRLIALLLPVAGGLYWWQANSAGGSQVTFKTESAVTGDLLASISATGTLEPEDVIDVGTQVPGLIKEFGKGSDGKSIDYGSPVDAGTVLARIDDSLFAAKVDQARAAVRSAEQKVVQAKARVDQSKAKVEEAKANTRRAEADVKQAVAKANQATRDWERSRKIGTGGAQSLADIDLAVSNYEVNNAAVTVAEAAVLQNKAAELDAAAAVGDAEAAVGDAEAAVMNSKALLRQDEINLGYCTIASNVKGTIVDRRVTIGQTVQSSFNTPSLFLIAKDLTRMVVWASVNEADISQVRIDQPVTFTVDAYPNRKFAGTVKRIRLNATNTQNVVVYTVEVLTDNKDGKLLPYMTANLQFEVARRELALLIPNAALRYRPSSQALAKALPAKEAPKDAGDKKAMGTVWVSEEGRVRPIPLKLGITDGNNTEVLEGGLEPGAALIVGEAKAGPIAEAVQNPFAPKMGGGKKQ